MVSSFWLMKYLRKSLGDSIVIWEIFIVSPSVSKYYMVNFLSFMRWERSKLFPPFLELGGGRGVDVQKAN